MIDADISTSCSLELIKAESSNDDMRIVQVLRRLRFAVDIDGRYQSQIPHATFSAIWRRLRLSFPMRWMSRLAKARLINHGSIHKYEHNQSVGRLSIKVLRIL